jgi:hypothetical protein
MMCEGSGYKVYDSLRPDHNADDGKMKCHVCGTVRKPNIYWRHPKGESWTMPVFTMPDHDRK